MTHDVGRWLEGLGLEQYAQAFADNDVDADLLTELDEDDLERLGIASLGHRKRLLRAIAAMDAAAPIDGAPTAAKAGEKLPHVAQEAERRQLTVMFCDLVGSTELSRRLDPEELREVMRRYQDAVVGAVTRYGGHVAKYLGDGVLAYFGWPQAYEDQAERAVRAGLDAVSAVNGVQVTDESALEARVGIATGQVVVGDLVGESGRDTGAVTGETPNLAARLQQVAAPGQVVVGAATHLLVGQAFTVDDLGSHDLKGFDGAVRAWGIAGEVVAESRFEAMHGASLTRLVGREVEVALLVEKWEQAKDGEGQVVLLAGEAGIGKSRVSDVLCKQVAAEPHVRLRYQGSPHHTNSAFYPVVTQLEHAAEFERDDGPDTQLDKLETIIAEPAARLLFAAMLSLPLDRYPPLNLEPAKQKEATIAALAARVESLAREAPVLMIVEDAHWIDPTTLEALSAIIERVGSAAILMVVTHRPDFEPPWRGRGYLTNVTLNRLRRRQSAELVAKVTGGKALPVEVLDQIVAKTDGVPLFIEELTKTVLEADILEERESDYALAGPLLSLAIPATLQGSLMARIDRSPTLREVAQLGAVLGREFDYEMLNALGAIKETALLHGLDLLVAEELLYQRGRPPQAKYVFKHALIRDAAYHSLLKQTRQQHHRHVARVLEDRFPAEVAVEPELLAYHYTGAGMAREAIAYWLKAARRSAGRSAYVEALAHLDAGSALLESLPKGRERTHHRLQLQILRATTLFATKGMSAGETGEAYGLARELCKELGEGVAETFPALWGIFTFYNVRAEYHLSHEVARDALQRAERLGDPRFLVLAHRMVGPPLVQTGQLATASEHLEEVNRLYDPERDRESALVYGVDLKAGGQAFLALATFMLGRPDGALALAREALGHAEGLEHSYSINFAQNSLALVHFLRREQESSLAQARLMRTQAEKRGFSQWSAYAKGHCGRALIELDEIDDGLRLIREALQDGEVIGIGFNEPFNLASLAAGAAKAGKLDEAEKQLANALRRVEELGERWYEAEIHRLEGELVWTKYGAAAAPQAEESFRRSLDVARHQVAKSWELRTATSLAHLWHSQGKTQQACDLLFPIYDWFTEGFDTADLKDAKALLDELS